MALNTEIAWTGTPRRDGTIAPGHTGNLWWGCDEVHAGCNNCYARVLANRWGLEWGANTPRKKIKGALTQFQGMQRKAAAAGEQHKVFVGSMMDLFEKAMPLADHHGNLLEYTTEELRTRFFREVVPACPNLLFLLLTKRPSNINKMIPPEWLSGAPENVMFGTSIVDPATARTLSRQLQKVRGRLFYSVEPQLEFIDFSKGDLLKGVRWLIQGGESGPKCRPFNPDWARHTRDVCAEYFVRYFFKQWDKVKPIPADLHTQEFPGHYDRQRHYLPA